MFSTSVLYFTINRVLKRITRECYEQLYANKFNNLDETDKFFEKHNLPKQTQNEVKSLNSPIHIKELNLSNHLPHKETPGLVYFTD